MNLQENKKQMFEILKNNKEFLNKEENKDLKMLILYLKTAQRMNEMTIKCLRRGIEELEKQLKSEHKTIDFKDWVIDDLSTKLRKAHDEIEILDNSSIAKEIEESNK